MTQTEQEVQAGKKQKEHSSLYAWLKEAADGSAEGAAAAAERRKTLKHPQAVLCWRLAAKGCGAAFADRDPLDCRVYRKVPPCVVLMLCAVSERLLGAVPTSLEVVRDSNNGGRIAYSDVLDTISENADDFDWEKPTAKGRAKTWSNSVAQLVRQQPFFTPAVYDAPDEDGNKRLRFLHAHTQAGKAVFGASLSRFGVHDASAYTLTAYKQAVMGALPFVTATLAIAFPANASQVVCARTAAPPKKRAAFGAQSGEPKKRTRIEVFEEKVLERLAAIEDKLSTFMNQHEANGRGS